MQIFTESLLLLRVAERVLLRTPTDQHALVDAAKGFTVYPLQYLKLGAAEKTKSASLWAFLSFLFLMFGTWIISQLGISNTEVANLVLLASMFVPLLIVLFALPSSYGHGGITQEDVQVIINHLTKQSVCDVKDMELIRSSVKPFEDQARSRVTVLKWIVGLLWASLTYTYSKLIDGAIPPTQIAPFALTTSLLLLGVAAAYVLVWGYEASLDKTFRLIEFACNDYASLLQCRSANAG